MQAKLVTEQLAGGTFGGNRPEVSRTPGYIICERLEGDQQFKIYVQASSSLRVKSRGCMELR